MQAIYCCGTITSGLSALKPQESPASLSPCQWLGIREWLDSAGLLRASPEAPASGWLGLPAWAGWAGTAGSASKSAPPHVGGRPQPLSMRRSPGRLECPHGVTASPEQVSQDNLAEAAMPFITSPQKTHSPTSTASGVADRSWFSVGEGYPKACIQQVTNRRGCCGDWLPYQA